METPSQRPAGATAARRRGRVLAVAAALLAGCGGSGGDPAPLVVDVRQVDVDASLAVGTLAPLWRDHYDLSWEHMAYAAEPGFPQLVAELAPRSWRCSVGRWEVSFPPPPGGDSLDPLVLQGVEREFYRGADTLAAADDPASYDFTYLDAQLAGLVAAGVEPFLCFDYMPFTLSSEQDPLNPFNFNVTQPGTPYALLSFSNGIRTAPPADPAVYARVVRNTVRHVRGLFAGATDFGVEYVEVGNEPDLVDAAGAPLRFFWTGDRAQWFAMYAAIAAEVDADPALSGLVKLGGGSFGFLAFEPQPTFLADVLTLTKAAGTRLDFVSYHSYGDAVIEHIERLLALHTTLGALALAPERINAEWGRALDGFDPVYDTIEHGLFRARVLVALEAFGVGHAHEALFRNPGTLPGEIGLVRTGPPAHKPVSHVYLALGRLDATPQALAISAPGGTYALAGRDAAGTLVTVALAAAEPAPGHATRYELEVTGLPWGNAPFELRLSKVTEATSAAGVGVQLVATESLGGGALATQVTIGAGQAGLYLWELSEL